VSVDSTVPGPKDEGGDSLKVLRGAGLSAVGGALQAALRMVSSLLITRSLGAEAFGIFVLANRVTLMGTLFSDAGQSDAAMHFVALHRGERAPGKALGAFRLTLGISLMLSLVMAIAVYVSAPIVANRVFHNPELVPIIRLLALAVPPSVVVPVCVSALRGTRNVRDAVLIRSLVVPGARVVLFAAFLLLGMRLFGLVWAFILSLVAGMLYGLWRLRRSARWMASDVVAEYQVKRVLMFSLPLVLFSVLGYVYSSSDVLIVGYYRPEKAVGIYGLATRVVGMLSMPVGALSALFVPLCAELYGAGQMDRLRRMFQATTSWGLRATIPVCLATVLFAGPLMSVFGPEFTEGATCLKVMSSMAVTSTFSVLAGYAVYMSGRSWVVTCNAAAQAAMSVVLSLALVPRYGIEGAAVARAVGMAVLGALTVFEASYFLGIRPLHANMLKSLLAAGVSFAICRMLLEIDVLDGSRLAAVSLAILFFALYLGQVWLLGLTEDEHYVLERLRARFRGAGKQPGTPA